MASEWNPDPSVHDYSGPYPLAEIEDARQTLINCLRFPDTELLKQVMPKVGIATEYGPSMAPPPLFRPPLPPPRHFHTQANHQSRYSNGPQFHTPNESYKSLNSASMSSSSDTNTGTLSRPNLISLTDKNVDASENMPVFFSNIQHKDNREVYEKRDTNMVSPRKAALLPTPSQRPMNPDFNSTKLQTSPIQGKRTAMHEQTAEHESDCKRTKADLSKENAKENSDLKRTETNFIKEIEIDYTSMMAETSNLNDKELDNTDIRGTNNHPSSSEWNTLMKLPETNGIPGLDLLPDDVEETESKQPIEKKASDTITVMPDIPIGLQELRQISKAVKMLKEIESVANHGVQENDNNHKEPSVTGDNQENLKSIQEKNSTYEIQKDDCEGEYEKVKDVSADMSWSDIPIESKPEYEYSAENASFQDTSAEISWRDIPIEDDLDNSQTEGSESFDLISDPCTSSRTNSKISTDICASFVSGVKSINVWESKGMFGESLTNVISILKCDTCNYACKTVTEIENHLRLCCHYSGSRYKASLGSNEELTLISVEEMLSVKNNDGYFSRQVIACPECSDVFPDVFMCSVHSKLVHGSPRGCFVPCPVINEDIINIPTVPECPSCFRKFTRQSELNLHWKEMAHHNPVKPSGNQSFLLFFCDHKKCNNLSYNNVGLAIAHVLTHVQKLKNPFGKKNAVKIIMKEILKPKVIKQLPEFDSERKNGATFTLEVLKQMKTFYSNVMMGAVQKLKFVQCELDRLKDQSIE